MTTITPALRQARPADAAALAELINYAGEGLPLQMWETMRQPGETAWDVGRRRAMREEGGFSYRNATVADLDGRAIAALIGYAQPPEPEPIDYDTTPPAFVPLLELENLAPDSWYVNVLAVSPGIRGKGLGTTLLAVADKAAASAGKMKLSVIVTDANSGANRLYLRCGYQPAAIRSVVRDHWSIEGNSWVLLTKTL